MVLSFLQTCVDGWYSRTHKLFRTRPPVLRLWLEALEDRTLLSAGALDPTFGSGGVLNINDSAILPFNPSVGRVLVAAQGDGKVLEVGLLGYGSAFEVLRENSDGSLDPTFGSGGQIFVSANGETLSESNTADSAEDQLGFITPSAVAIQPDGQILVAGTYTYRTPQEVSEHTPAQVNSFVLARFNSDGTVDSNFGTGGMVVTSVGQDDTVAAIAVEADGKIVLAGNSSLALTVVRYNADDSLDTTFGNGGVGASIGIVGSSLAVQDDGKIIVAGEEWEDAALVRYNTDGSLDSTFGDGGTVDTNLPSLSSNGDVFNATDVVLQANGDVVFAGWVITAGVNYSSAIVRYNPTQEPQPVIMAGVDYSSVIVRYTPDGQLDTTFGNDGYVLLGNSMNNNVDGVQLAMQADGKILLATNEYDTTDTTQSIEVELARYDSDGVADPTFGNDGQEVMSLEPNTSIIPTDMTLQADGSIVVAGYSQANGVAVYEAWDGSTILNYSVAEGTNDLIVARFTNDSLPLVPIASSPPVSPAPPQNPSDPIAPPVTSEPPPSPSNPIVPPVISGGTGEGESETPTSPSAPIDPPVTSEGTSEGESVTPVSVSAPVSPPVSSEPLQSPSNPIVPLVISEGTGEAESETSVSLSAPVAPPVISEGPVEVDSGTPVNPSTPIGPLVTSEGTGEAESETPVNPSNPAVSPVTSESPAAPVPLILPTVSATDTATESAAMAPVMLLLAQEQSLPAPVIPTTETVQTTTSAVPVALAAEASAGQLLSDTNSVGIRLVGGSGQDNSGALGSSDDLPNVAPDAPPVEVPADADTFLSAPQDNNRAVSVVLVDAVFQLPLSSQSHSATAGDVAPSAAPLSDWPAEISLSPLPFQKEESSADSDRQPVLAVICVLSAAGLAAVEDDARRRSSSSTVRLYE